MKQQGHAWWLIGAVLVAGVWTVSACVDEGAATDPGASTSSSGSTTTGGSSGDVTSSSGGSSGSTTSSGGSSGGSSGDASNPNDPNATPPNFKVAFIGDTDVGQDFKDVLALIKREGAKAVVIQGDIEYGGNTAPDFFPVIDAELQAGATKIPYFISRGNHDDDWTAATGLGTGLETRLTQWGITPESNKPTENNYALTYQGLKMVFVHESTTTNPTRQDYVKAQLANDKHYWKICSWHKNQRNSNIGPKSDEMGWEIYENCRAAGAIVAQGHSHTYSRSKTLTADQALTVDPACNDPFALCVGPGKHFFFDSSVGGVDLRTINGTIAAMPHWASTYAANFGALFIEFNVDGDPKKAKGYFKNVDNQVIDPPASSGKTSFTITSTN